MKLVPVATAPDQLTAEMWQELLTSEGIPATIDMENAISFLGISSRPCRVLVAEEQVEQARAVLFAQDTPAE